MELTIWTALFLAITSYALYFASKALRIVLQPFFSPLRILRGPSGGGFVSGHLGAILTAPYSDQHEAWMKEYGGVMKYKGFFNVRFVWWLCGRLLMFWTVIAGIDVDVAMV